MQAQCTGTGAASSCMAQYPEMPQASDADTSTADMAKVIEHLLWFIAIGGALLLLSTGRVEAVGLLLLLIIARVNSEELPSKSTSLNLLTTSVDSTTTAGFITVPTDMPTSHTTTTKYSTPPIDHAPTTTNPPNTTFVEKVLLCYSTANGLMYPDKCPADLDLPPPNLEPGDCLQNGVVVHCGAGIRSAASITTMASLGSVLNGLWLPLVAYGVGVIDGKTMMWMWLGTVLNVHVLASPQQVVSAPAVTSTITVYEASRVGITATVTALHAFTARDDLAGCSATADSVFLARDTQRLANATMATLRRAAETCSTLYGMQNCQLSTTGPIASSASNYRPLPLDRLILGLALPLLLNGRLLYAFWGLMAAAHVHAQIPGASGLTSAHAPGAQVVGGLTSVPLPQLAVNTTTTPAVTVTQTMFVAGPNVQFTPTITEYIAVCTPYCAHMNKVGTCEKIQGCEGVVTNGGSGSIVLAAYVCALAGLVSFVFAWGMTVGRMGLWMDL
ncbi:hypothetical protein LTR56_004512 [Elasticomyces elasticus]|nr:hypothetical protein LTR56_004512 [Elasticomyces elasticus]KAK3654246.1 hypothetical protein LTR22_010872 [Elasticomyces elasticus]KAK4919981.1 hypothetical protein LTR49_012419 [Elasticomyces elasticus]KAK5758815.1 hypothetical protein LTS12_011056 [Elasticomyces elasticus]